jgi:hypothetical protein
MGYRFIYWDDVDDQDEDQPKPKDKTTFSDSLEDE